MLKKSSSLHEKKAPVAGYAVTAVAENETHNVTPAGRENVNNLLPPHKRNLKKGASRVLFGGSEDYNSDISENNTDAVQTLKDSTDLSTANKKRKVHVITPSAKTTIASDDKIDDSSVQIAPSAKRRLIFGRYVPLVQCAVNVDSVYKIVRKLTGNIGGNGYSGPIYGELTKHSMQKMVNLMVQTTGFSASSRFIDVGSGIGKPNLHVAQFPGVEFSCGVEMEHNRWSLGMTCLKACLHAAVEERNEESTSSDNNHVLLQGNTIFLHNNILEAKTFDPFTHVYMFSIGFPPDLWIALSKMWNASDARSCQYLICYAGPKDIIDCYEFNVELISQVSTSMHGSKENHMGYIYRRTGVKEKSPKEKKSTLDRNVPCDPLFKPSYNLVGRGLKELQREVNRQVDKELGGSQRTTRSRQKIVFSKSYTN